MHSAGKGRLCIPGPIGSGTLASSLGLDLSALRDYVKERHDNGQVLTVRQSKTVCSLCSIGCGLIYSTDEAAVEILCIEGDPDHPSNLGAICGELAKFLGLSADLSGLPIRPECPSLR
jgi:formate dehydrogenase major subunit